MNIDLLISRNNEAGLLCSENLISKAVGAILDTENGQLSFEFEQMEPMELNIPIEAEFYDLIESSPLIHVGSVKNGEIGQAYQIPLYILNDPYRTQMLEQAEKPKVPLQAFYYFVKNCFLGQPAHRDDMGNEDTSGCILGDTTPSSLEFAKELTKRHGMELQSAPSLNVAPSGLGLGGSGSAGRTRYTGGASRQPLSNGDDSNKGKKE